MQRTRMGAVKKVLYDWKIPTVESLVQAICKVDPSLINTCMNAGGLFWMPVGSTSDPVR
jgi:hypothetical protein